MSIMKDTTDDTRVSVREVKEETYRALRAAGYPWGEAQAAGRLVAQAELLWGTGVAMVVADAGRWFVTRRTLRMTTGESGVRITDNRRTSAVIVGNHAVAVALGRPGICVRVRGRQAVREVATAVWDLQTTGAPIVWGSVRDGVISGYSVDDAGNLYAHDDIPGEFAGPSLGEREWFLRQAELPGGRLLMTTEHRQQCGVTAARHGVAVDPDEWATLMRRSRKFLVAE